MKIGTDSVLIGTWADCINLKNILDIGTGTGIIALMMAQRSDALITAIEIDHESYKQAKENVLNSAWTEQIFVKHISLQEFTENNTEKFDLIITNPPYFKNSFKPPDISRKIARHNDLLSFEELVYCVSKLISENGFFSLIIPYTESDNFINIANKHNLHYSYLK
ncbi:MAG: methyltransferase, partial [Bacteroidales bacterium]|nr:methyltransferase [Bacteroidales bacterium]